MPMSTPISTHPDNHHRLHLPTNHPPRFQHSISPQTANVSQQGTKTAPFKSTPSLLYHPPQAQKDLCQPHSSLPHPPPDSNRTLHQSPHSNSSLPLPSCLQVQKTAHYVSYPPILPLPPHQYALLFAVPQKPKKKHISRAQARRGFSKAIADESPIPLSLSAGGMYSVRVKMGV
jgi:hypothetical protein